MMNSLLSVRDFAPDTSKKLRKYLLPVFAAMSGIFLLVAVAKLF